MFDSFYRQKTATFLSDTTNKTQSPLQWLLQKHLSLFHVLDKQPRWQLWIASSAVLNKRQLQQAGLNTNKIMHYTINSPVFTLLEKALLSTNFSYIAICTNHLNYYEIRYLRNLANIKGTHLFVVHEEYLQYHTIETKHTSANITLSQPLPLLN